MYSVLYIKPMCVAFNDYILHRLYTDQQLAVLLVFAVSFFLSFLTLGSSPNWIYWTSFKGFIVRTKFT